MYKHCHSTQDVANRETGFNKESRNEIMFLKPTNQGTDAETKEEEGSKKLSHSNAPRKDQSNFPKCPKFLIKNHRKNLIS